MLAALSRPRPRLRQPVLACLLAIACLAPARAEPPAQCPEGTGAAAFALPQTARAIRDGRPVTIIAFGSSSTEGAGASAPARSYPARLEARLRAALPGAPLRVLNRGRGGQEVAEMLARLERDVIAERPTLVVWQAGANAVLRGMPPEAFHLALSTGLARLKAAGIEVVLMDSQRAPRITGNPNHAVFDALMAGLAAEQHVPLFSRARLMGEWQAAGAPPASFLVEDGLHHNDRGYDCVAAALSQSLVGALGRPAARIAGR